MSPHRGGHMGGTRAPWGGGFARKYRDIFGETRKCRSGSNNAGHGSENAGPEVKMQVPKGENAGPEAKIKV